MSHSLARGMDLAPPPPYQMQPQPCAQNASVEVSPFRFVLVLRCCLLNAVALALVALAALHGLVGQVLAADTTYITHLIVVVFVVGLVTCVRRIVHVSRELNDVKSGVLHPQGRAGRFLASALGADAQARASLAGSLRLKLSSRIAGIRQYANNLVLLGLIGTVVGFIMALSGVDPEAAGDAAAIAPMVSSLIQGMGVALYTTLVGAVLNIWLMLNCRLLETATVSLVTQLVDRAEGATDA